MGDSMKHILIVDDDSDIRLLLRSILESYGYRCDEARNGLEAVRKIEACAFALILLDYSMPVMNGLELIRRITRTSWCSRPQMIMMTAHTDETLRSQALEAGAAAVLSKPFDLDQVLLAIGRALKDAHVSSPCHHHPS